MSTGLDCNRYPTTDADRVPSENVTTVIRCDASGSCTNSFTVTLDMPAGRMACIVADNVGHSLEVSKVAAQQTPASKDDVIQYCSPIQNDITYRHSGDDAVFTDAKAVSAWMETKGTVTTFSFCQNPGAPTNICKEHTTGDAGVGVKQHCGGRCDMMLLAKSFYPTCDDGLEMRFYGGVCQNSTNPFTVTQLSFANFTMHLTAVIGGQKLVFLAGQGRDNAAFSSLVEFSNPFAGSHMVLKGSDPSSARVRRTAFDPLDCSGYCGLSSTTSQWTVKGNCMYPKFGCTDPLVWPCEVGVSLFEDSKTDFSLPLTLYSSDIELGFDDSASGYVLATVPVKKVPLRGTFTFTVLNPAKVTPEEAASNMRSIPFVVVPQSARFHDVVVLRTHGAVATSSRDCLFSYLGERDMYRIYSMSNVMNGTNCDLLLSNGVSQQSLTIAAQTDKLPNATDADWSEAFATLPADWDKEPASSRAAMIGLGVGLGVGIPVVVALTIVAICCIRWYRKTRRTEAAERPATVETVRASKKPSGTQRHKGHTGGREAALTQAPAESNTTCSSLNANPLDADTYSLYELLIESGHYVSPLNTSQDSPRR